MKTNGAGAGVETGFAYVAGTEAGSEISLMGTKTVEELFCAYEKTGAEEVRSEIINKFLYLAELLARRFVGRGVEYDDLFQVASYGLVLSVDRYDPGKGLAFVTFATPTIIGEIKKYFRDATWSLKVSRHLKDVLAKIHEVKETLQDELGHVPNVKELAEYIKVSEEEIIEALESGHAYTTFSLDQEVDSEVEGDVAFEKFLSDTESGFGYFELSVILSKVMQTLSATEKDIVRKRFVQEMSQREVAEALGISQMTVSRIEKAMKAKFRDEYMK